MRIPEQYRDNIKTWLRNNAHKAVHTSELGDQYLDIQELVFRMRKKIVKATPLTEEDLTEEDLEELFDPYFGTIMGHLGVTKIGSGPHRHSHIAEEDPDA